MGRTIEMNEIRELTTAELDAVGGGMLSEVYLYTVVVSNPALFLTAVGMFGYAMAQTYVP